MTQKFKGDAKELKFIAVGEPVFDLTDISLDEFYADGFDCAPLLLMLYDEKRMPFSNRIPRAAFVDFIREALKQFPVTGIFESYIFVLKSVFGQDTDIFFDVPAPGKLEIEVDALASSEFDFIAREFIDGVYVFSNMVDYDGNILTFRGVPGISSEYELNLLFSEIMPAGIVPTISLEFISRYVFVAEEDDVLYDVLTQSNDNIIFYEIGG